MVGFRSILKFFAAAARVLLAVMTVVALVVPPVAGSVMAAAASVAPVTNVLGGFLGFDVKICCVQLMFLMKFA